MLLSWLCYAHYCPKSGARLRGNAETTADDADVTDKKRILWKRSFRRAFKHGASTEQLITSGRDKSRRCHATHEAFPESCESSFNRRVVMPSPIKSRTRQTPPEFKRLITLSNCGWAVMTKAFPFTEQTIHYRHSAPRSDTPGRHAPRYRHGGVSVTGAAERARSQNLSPDSTSLPSGSKQFQYARSLY